MDFASACRTLGQTVPARAFRLVFAAVLAFGAVATSRSPSQARDLDPFKPDTFKLAPVAIDAQLTGDQQSTRLAFTLSAPVEPKVRMLEKPDRIVIDLPEVNFQIPPELGRKGRGLVKSFRSGLMAQGRSRIVIELTAPALPVRVASEAVMGGAAASLTIELRKADREAFAKAAVPEIREDPVPPRVAGPVDGRPVIVLDPGHGGIDTGAIGVGQTVEKDVVFAFTRQLRDKLEASGRYKVVMTRESDVFVSLRDRVKVAQANNASLFVSIHADTLVVSPEVRGMTVYTNSERASDAEAARLAESENKADSVAGLDPNEDPEEVAGILSDLMRRETRTYSHLFARTLVGQITAASRLNKNPQRSAGFWVLRAPDVPSVLLELGYLSSKSDVQLLTQAEWRDKAAEAIAFSISSFLAPRIAQQAAAATR